MIVRETFEYFVNERIAILEARQAGLPPPWTKDDILASWRFCNIDRNEDTVTQWIFHNIIDEMDGEDATWHNLVVARFVNWPDTLAEVGIYDKWVPKRFCKVMRDRRERGEKVYTGAYMIRAGTGEDAKLPKEEYLCKRVFNPLWARRDETEELESCEDWSAFLGSTFGMGDFMRNQVITDMKYSHHLANAEDWGTFCLAGPGTSRGLNRYLGRPLNAPWKADQANIELRRIRYELGKKYAEVFADLNNLSNSFCEFDKYMRVLLNEGTPRSKYRAS